MLLLSSGSVPPWIEVRIMHVTEEWLGMRRVVSDEGETTIEFIHGTTETGRPSTQRIIKPREAETHAYTFLCALIPPTNPKAAT